MKARGKAGWSRWLFLVAMVITAASLVVSLWLSYRGVRDASEALTRGQSAALQADLRAEFAVLGSDATEEELKELLAAYQEQGLRYVALVDRGVPALEAGTPSLAGAGLLEGIAKTRRGERVDSAEVERLFLRARGGRARARRNALGNPPPIYAEFVPTEARALRASSRRSLAIGSTASVFLLLLAAYMGRLFARQDREHRREQEDRRLKALGQMSAVLAHEIRNPLASLKGNAQLLESMVGKDAAPESKVMAKVQRVVTEAVRLEDLVSDLLEFARGGALRREARDPGQVLEQSVALIGGAQIRLDLSHAPKKFSLDAARMQQVLCNLLQNAVDTGAAVEASCATEGSALVFRVRDHGAGIDESERELLFEPFHTKKATGTGLGLAVAKRIVDLHGGTLSVSNASGGGAEFVVTLLANP